MAQKRKPYHWNRVRAGDIISFKYKGSGEKKLIHTILVLNPKIRNKLASGKSKFYLIGIKLEENNIPTFRINSTNMRILSRLGKFEAVDEEFDLYKVSINKSFLTTPLRGAKYQAYKTFKMLNIIKDNYRTYIWEEAKKGGVYLEPLIIPKAVKNLLSEEGKKDKKPDMGWKKKNIQKWMDNTKIDYLLSDSKKDLLKKIEDHSDEIVGNG